VTIIVDKNADGSYTVTCGSESVDINKKPKGRSASGSSNDPYHPVITGTGGGATATIIDAKDVPHGLEHSNDVTQLLWQIESHRDGVGPWNGQSHLPEVHFALKGNHRLDMAAISMATQGPEGRARFTPFIHMV
jgi:hypothetical protein